MISTVANCRLESWNEKAHIIDRDRYRNERGGSPELGRPRTDAKAESSDNADSRRHAARIANCAGEGVL